MTRGYHAEVTAARLPAWGGPSRRGVYWKPSLPHGSQCPFRLPILRAHGRSIRVTYSTRRGCANHTRDATVTTLSAYCISPNNSVKVFASERVVSVCLPRDRGRRRLARRLKCFHAYGLEFAEEDAHIHPAISSAYRVFPVSWPCRGFKLQTGKVASARMEATESGA